MLVGVDIDGVLFPWEDAVADALVAKFGIEHPGPMVTWNDYADRLPELWAWLWTPEGIDAVLCQTWRTYPGVIESIRGVIEAGHSVHFVTHRAPCGAGHWTASYIARHFHGLDFHGLHVLRSSVAKRTLARWDVFVDDKPETVFDFIANTTAVVFAPVRAWNVDELGGRRVTGLYHYTDPADIVEWVAARS